MMKPFPLMGSVLLLPVLAGVMLVPALSKAEVVDKIEVIVNDEMITRREIDRLLAPVYERYSAMYDSEALLLKISEARQKIIEQMIEEKLIYSEAKKLNVNVDEKEIDEKIENTMKRAGGKTDFENMLALQQITLKELRARYKEQTMSRRLIEHKVGSKVTITPAEVSDYYASHIEQFAQPEELLVRNIMIRPGEDPGRSANLANDISKRLSEGCDFGGLAKIYSEGPGAGEGGSMGYVKRGDLMPAIEDVIFKLKDGEVSGVIQTSVGYHIFKVEERRPAKVRSLEEARREVEEAVFMEKMNQKVKAWVEGLKKNAYIEIR